MVVEFVFFNLSGVMPKLLLCALFFFSLCSASANATVTMKIEGVSGDVKKNIEAYLSNIDQGEYSFRLRFRSKVEEQINQALNALGYYHGEIDFKQDETSQTLTVAVTPGEAVRLRTVQIDIDGEAEGDSAFNAVIEDAGLKQGDVLNHGKYDALKSRLQSLSLERGYFSAKFTRSELAVLVDENVADVFITYASGPRYRFGDVSISGSQIEEQRIRSLQPFAKGDPYRLSSITTFNSNLNKTSWFESVVVQPQFSDGEAGTLPVSVALKPAKSNQIETGIGYSTDVGVRGTLSWNKPWLNEQGHSFDSSFSISKPEQVITASYKIPLEDVLHDYYQVQYGLKHVDKLDTQSIESNLSFERHWLVDDGWNKTVFIRHLLEDYEQGVLDDVGQFVLPGVTFSRTRTRGNKLITWGDKETLTAEYGSKHLLSETDLIRIQASSTWLRSWGENQRGFIRVNGGANFADDFDKLSPSLRFFTGGDNSVRGYDYESISPTDESGSLTGAKYMATSTLEYQHRISGNWWGALFYDVGDAFNDEPDWKRGTGVGVRWVSPIGPVSLDFAWGLDAEDGFKIHFTIGPEL